MQSLKERKAQSLVNLAGSTTTCVNPFIKGRFCVGGLFFVLLLSAALFIVLSVSWAKFSRAEVFFAECAREMLAKSNFVTPLYHGKPFFDKPILTYWLIGACFKSFGVCHFAARLPSIVAALLTILATAVGTSMLFGIECGLIAAMALSSSFMFLSFASLCMSDMPLLLFDTLTMSLLLAGVVVSRRRGVLWWLASIAMGLAFLTKGPVGVVLPIVSFLSYLLLTKQRQMITLRHLLVAFLTIIVICLPWFIAAWQANGSGSLYYFFIHENLERFAGATYDTHRPFWYMIASLFSGFAPWSVFLALALIKSIQTWLAGQRDEHKSKTQPELYLWLWIATVTCFFSFSRGKLDYYMLPAYPAAAALVGLYLHKCIHDHTRVAKAALFVFAASFIVIGITSPYLLYPLSNSAPPSQWLIMPLCLTFSGLLTVFTLLQQRYLQAILLLYTGLSLAVIGFALQMFPAINKFQPTVSYAAFIRKSKTHAKIGIYKSLESWIDEITFQTGLEPSKLNNLQDLNQLLLSEKPAVAMAPQNLIDQLPATTLLHLRIIDCQPLSSHPITPGYLIKNRGKLADKVSLVLVKNQE